jgi:3-hydroxyacyl-CoA dehydrogenase/3a,7a,12a-trihydroxy-5b-cholest-24-enoyl-CoA hydratase
MSKTRRELRHFDIHFVTVEVVDESGDKVISAQWSIFVVGAGGFGGKRNSEHIVPHVDPPKRKPDASLTYKTSIDQVRIHFKC